MEGAQVARTDTTGWEELTVHPKYAAVVRAHAEELERLAKTIRSLNVANAEAYEGLAKLRKEGEELRGQSGWKVPSSRSCTGTTMLAFGSLQQRSLLIARRAADKARLHSLCSVQNATPT